MIYNSLLESFILPIGDLLFGNYFTKSLKQVRKESRLSSSDLSYLQRERLYKTLNHARQYSAYYSKIIPDCNPVNPYETLRQIPILTKKDIRLFTNQIATVPTEGLIKLSSSGSTGQQTDIYLNKRELSIDRAIQILWWEWAGYKMGMPMLQTGLASSRSLEKKLKDFFFRTKYLFAFGLQKEDLKPLEKWISNKRPFLGGYASSLYVISTLLKEKNYEFRSAVSWGDKLFDHYKVSIIQNLGCNIFETYGTGEALKIAAQKDLPYMYIMSPYVWLEILDEDGNEVQDGELGQVVATSLVNRAMPLIRYKLGDLAIKLPHNAYPKTSDLNLPLLQKVIGRETDIVRTPLGKRLIVHSFTGILEYYPEIIQFCVVQESIHGVTIKYIKSERFKPSILDEIANKLKTLIVEPFDIKFLEVEYIPPTNSGKPQIIISKI